MVKRRKTNVRRSEPVDRQVVWLVHTLFQGIERGFVTLPSCVYHYQNVIYTAMEGDLGPLHTQLERIASRSKMVRDDVKDSSVLTKWKGGMASYWSNIFYVLSLYYQLFTQYHKAIHDNPNILSTVPVVKPSGNPHKVPRGPRTKSAGNYRECEQIAI